MIIAPAAGFFQMILLRRLQPHTHKLKLAEFPPPRILERPLFVLGQAPPGLLAFPLETFDFLPLGEEVVDGAFATEEVAVCCAGDGAPGWLHAESTGAKGEEGVAADDAALGAPG